MSRTYAVTCSALIVFGCGSSTATSVDANATTTFEVGLSGPEANGPLSGNDAGAAGLDSNAVVTIDVGEPPHDGARALDGSVDNGIALDPATSAYAIDGWGEIGALDLTTGHFTKIGNGLYGSGYGPSRGLGAVKVDGQYRLFAASSAGDKGGTLWSIQTATGQATLIGTSGITYNALGSTSAGLFALGYDPGSTTEKLYSISPATGVTTAIGPSGAGTGLDTGNWYFGYDALSTSVDSPALYAPYGGNGIQLFSVSSSLGKWTPVAVYKEANHAPGLAIYAGLYENGILYAAYDHIDIIDTASGDETLGIAITGTNGNIYGLAPVLAGP